MLLEEFVKTYNGKKVDVDNFAGAQCVDLFRKYNYDVNGIKEHTGSCATSGGAKDLFLDYDKMPIEKKYFIRSTNKSYIQGDILVWDKVGNNNYGHVAIYLGKINNSFIVFEQDGIKQDGAKINIRNKDGLLGYLRKR
jgi:hypothetical protein